MKLTMGIRKFVDANLWLSLTSFLPRSIGSRLSEGLEAREVLVKAIDKYFMSGSHVNGSPLVNAHYPIFSAQLAPLEVARFEAANGVGALANTVATAFWAIFHTFSNPTLLKEVRKQVDAITTTETCPNTGTSTRKINLGKLKDAPILYSVTAEVTRYRATGNSFRMVMEDTTVGEGDDQYRLKKGSVVVIVNQAIHFDSSAWGENAEEFVGERFCAHTPPIAFRGFGNGPTTCCGKGLAMYHVSSLLALLVMRFDLAPSDESWHEPGKTGGSSAAHVAPPRKKVEVKMTPRLDVTDTAWDFVF